MITNIEEAFQTACITNNSLSFPVEISSKIYKKAKSMLSNIRGEYVGKAENGRFEFPFNPADIIEKFLETSEWPKKNPYALFPTPRCIIDYAIEYTYAGAQMWSGCKIVRILEPSAGRGDFIDEIVKDFKKHGIAYEVTCVEIDPVNIAILKNKGYSVIEGDFLNVDIATIGSFDLIITNPPFQRETYIKHVNHSQTFLSQQGKLLAVIPTKLFSSTSKIGIDLKHRVSASNIGEFADCIFAEGTFDCTEVETMLITLNSVEEDNKQLEHSVKYAASLMCLCVNNINHVNMKINSCTSEDALERLMPYLCDVFLEEDPYAFLNDDVISAAKIDLASTLELNDKKTVNTKPISVSVLSNYANIKNETIEPVNNSPINESELILSEICTVLAKTDEKCKPCKNVTAMNAPKLKRRLINESQMDMFAMT